MADQGSPPSSYKQRYGAHQKFFFVSCDIDRTSLAHIQVEMQVQDEGLNQANASFLSLGYGLGVAQQLNITGIIQVPQDHPEYICIGVNRRYDNAGSMGIYTYTYEGLLQNRVPYKQYELEFTMNQEPIETHPNFDKLDATYGPFNIFNRTWPRVPTAKQAQAGGLPGNSGNSAQVQINPMLGTTAYLSPGAVFRVMTTDMTIDTEFFNTVGTKDEPGDLQDAFPDFKAQLDQDKRDWLKMAPKFVKRGGAYQITLEWLLSGPRGWMEDMYGDKAIYQATGSGSNFTGNESSGGQGGTGPLTGSGGSTTSTGGTSNIGPIS